MGETKRLSAERLEAALNNVDGWSLHVGPQLRGHIAALEAEIARLKPSGQAAEDELLLVGALEHLHPKAGLLGFETDVVDAAARHLAAKAQGYEAAVADNAALLEFARAVDARRHALFDAASVAANAMEYGRHRDALLDVLSAHGGRSFPEGPHPGAALLEVVNAIRQYQRADEPDVSATLRRLLEERGRIAHMVDPEQHRKALVRARNDGVELAAVRLSARHEQLLAYAKENSSDVELATRYRYMAGECKVMANDVRSLKEPEQ